MSDIILEAKEVDKHFTNGADIHVLKKVSFEVDKGDFVSIVGKSGCGKSTLLYVLSTMDTDYDGDLIIDGTSMKGRTDKELAKVRNENIGFVFQFHYLLNEFSVLKNVMIPGLKAGKYSEEELEQRAIDKLKIFGVDDLALKKANRISGGQKQRVAIARALINDPIIIMGDEPTGNLDKKNSDVVFESFQKLAHERNQTLLIVTHDMDFANRTDRIIEMEDGRIRV